MNNQNLKNNCCFFYKYLIPFLFTCVSCTKNTLDSAAVNILEPDTSQALIKKLDWQFNDATFAQQQIGVFTVLPDKYKGNRIGNTGLCYNIKTNEIVIAMYDYRHASMLWFYRKDSLPAYNSELHLDPVPVRKIDVTKFISYIQGIAWSADENAYYIWGTQPGKQSNDYNRIVICIDDAGNKIKPDWITGFNTEPGMISVFKNYLFFKSDNNVDIRIYNLNTHGLEGIIHTNTADEGLAIDNYTGDIWTAGDGLPIIKYNYKMLEVASFKNPSTGEEIEGAMIDPCDDTFWFNADEQIHGSIKNGNRLWHMDFNKTYKKFIRFPDMISWSEGSLRNGLYISGKVLYGNGTWESPVLDFEDHSDYLKNEPQLLQSKKDVIITYCGSATAPTILQTKNEFINYYKGWGSTVPSTYSTTKPATRYVQFRITVSDKQ